MWPVCLPGRFRMQCGDYAVQVKWPGSGRTELTGTYIDYIPNDSPAERYAQVHLPVVVSPDLRLKSEDSGLYSSQS
jgi:hypothetical protein